MIGEDVRDNFIANIVDIVNIVSIMTDGKVEETGEPEVEQLDQKEGCGNGTVPTRGEAAANRGDLEVVVVVGRRFVDMDWGCMLHPEWCGSAEIIVEY